MSMSTPPTATAEVSGQEPVATCVARQAAAVVTRCPPGLMPGGGRKGRADPAPPENHRITRKGAHMMRAPAKDVAYRLRTESRRGGGRTTRVIVTSLGR